MEYLEGESLGEIVRRRKMHMQRAITIVTDGRRARRGARSGLFIAT
jgi:hypothetical protein